MSDKPRNYDKELSAVMNAVAESIADMSDEEIATEVIEEGYSDADTEHVKSVLRTAVKAHRQRHLTEAQKLYDERVGIMSNKKYSLPDSIEDQRSLMNALLASRPATGAALFTAQHREFKDIPDEEIEGYLRQLQELGALDDLNNPEGEKE